MEEGQSDNHSAAKSLIDTILRELPSHLVSSLEGEQDYQDCVLFGEDYLVPLSLLLEEDTRPGDRKLNTLLTNRLLLEAEFEKHKEKLVEQKLEAPVIIIGLPRTGSTLLHHVLANDEESFHTTKLWEIRRPVDTKDCPSPEERLRIEREFWEKFHKEKPSMAAIHDVRAEFPGECISVLELDLLCGTQIFRGVSPKYIKWYMSQPKERVVKAYQFHKKFMQRMQLLRGTQHQWLWKTPLHTFFLDAILEVYPDAKFIWTHRDPVKSVPSTCSLGAVMGGVDTENSQQMKRFGSVILDTFAEGTQRAVNFRRENGDKADRFFDCHMEDLVNAPIETLKRIYEFLGKPFTAEQERKASEWLAANPQNKHGAHDYSLETFGLEPEAIKDAFKDYIANFLSK